jgi:hypothetical protein
MAGPILEGHRCVPIPKEEKKKATKRDGVRVVRIGGKK